jgi:hypothetical protein
MRVYLKSSDLATDAGKQLLDLAIQVTVDGKLDVDEIKSLRSWLRANESNTQIAAIGYLIDIMNRIAADGIIDRDELLELHLAVERVVPAAYRDSIVQARKKRDALRRERLQEARRVEKEKVAEERNSSREECRNRRRLRHAFAKVAGVSFPNDDGSERQQIVRRCKSGEHLILRYEPDNAYSEFAIQVLRENGEQIGHAPEYLAERICEQNEKGYRSFGVVKCVTGGTPDKPTRGVNFLTVFVAEGVSPEELQQYVDKTFRADGDPVSEAGSGEFLSGASQPPSTDKPWWKIW